MSIRATPDSAPVYTDVASLRSLKGNSPEQIRATAEQFESLFVDLWIRSMREAGESFAEGNPMTSSAVKFHEDMLDRQWAVHISSNGGIGLADVLERQMTPPGRPRDPGAGAATAPTNTNVPNGDALQPVAHSPRIVASPATAFTLRARGHAAHDRAGPAAAPAGAPTPEPTDASRFRRDDPEIGAHDGLAYPDRPGDDAGGALHPATASIDRGTRSTTGSPYARWPTTQGAALPDATRGGTVAVGQVGADATVDAVPVGASNDGPDVRLGAYRAPITSGPEEFVRVLEPIARDVARETGLAAEAIVAHAALESGWGRKVIHAADGTPSLNLFGIKAGADWSAPSVPVDSLEFRGGRAVQETSRFRVYESLEASVRDLVGFLSSGARYAGVLASGASGEGYADAIGRSGYATDPAYSEKLRRVLAHPAVQGMRDAVGAVGGGN